MNGRAELAAAQAALVRALLAEGPSPPGFDPARLARQGAALRAKRRRLIAALRPDLTAALGERTFTAAFEQWARANPPRVGTGTHADAAAFAAWVTAEHTAGEAQQPALRGPAAPPPRRAAGQLDAVAGRRRPRGILRRGRHTMRSRGGLLPWRPTER